MTFIKFLLLLGATLFLIACAAIDDAGPTSDEGSAAHTKAATDMAGSHGARNEGLLMDQYKSGEIPGYRD